MREVEYVHPLSDHWEGLKRKLETALIKAELDVVLLESVEDQTPINANVVEPTAKIRIANDLELERCDFSDDEAFVRRVIYEIREINRLSGKEILVPMDFSETSINAFRYALGLAKHTRSLLRVLHFMAPLPDPNLDGLTYFNNDLEGERRIHWQDFVKSLGARFADDIAHLKHGIQEDFLVGNAKEMLVDLSRRSSTRMIVIGSTGAGKMLKSLFGSVSTFVALNASCPTIIVPADASFERHSRILLAIDWPNVAPALIDGLRQTLGTRSASIKAVQVYTKPNVYASDADELITDDPENQVQELILFRKNIFEGLNDFALQNQIDLITVIRKHRPLIQRLFHHSTSHDLAANSAIPLMVIHENEEGRDDMLHEKSN